MTHLLDTNICSAYQLGILWSEMNQGFAASGDNMNAIPAVFEKGIFRPLKPVQMDEGAQVQVVVPEPTVSEQIDQLQHTDPGLASIYEVLSRRHHSGQSDTAERHNEHQP